MLDIVKKLLKQVLDDINAGNSNITEEEGNEIIELLNRVNTEKVSKYQACQILNCSRATFDNMVKEGKLSKGKKQAGFKELFWNKSEILKLITKSN